MDYKEKEARKELERSLRDLPYHINCLTKKALIKPNSYKKRLEDYKKLLKSLKVLKQKLEEENLSLLQSPYSVSFYAVKKGEKIDWGYKPENSYRVSDHWNFETSGEIHCQTTKNIKNNDYTIAQFKNGKYHKVI